MSGTYKNGFTLLELLVVIMILGLVTTIAIPNLQQQLPRYQRQQFITQFETLVGLAWQQALRSGVVHRIHFDLAQRVVRIEEQKQQGSNDFAPISRVYKKTELIWPETVEIQQFFIDGTNRLGQMSVKVHEIWFFIVPDGLTQAVIINAIDTAEQRADNRDVEISLVVNPFSAEVKNYETFATP